MAPPSLDELSSETCFHNKQRIPELGLEANLDFEYRVYALACDGGRIYVGIAHKSWLARRLSSHFDGNGAFFTKQFPPREILLVFPAVNRAVEAYAYFALLAEYSASSVFRLGGWSQTSTSLSPLTAMMAERDRRLLTNHCLNCGGNHFAKDCKAQPDGRDYKCGVCTGTVRICNNGASVTTQPLRAPELSATLSSAKRPADVAPPSPAPMKVAKVPPRNMHVLVCGVQYTTLAWHLGRPNPTPKEVALVKQSCSECRLELSNGDSKTLQARGYVGHELLPGRERLLAVWMDSACMALKDDGAVKIRKPGGVATGCRQVLWRLSDLQKAFPSKT